MKYFRTPSNPKPKTLLFKLLIMAVLEGLNQAFEKAEKLWKIFYNKKIKISYAKFSRDHIKSKHLQPKTQRNP